MRSFEIGRPATSIQRLQKMYGRFLNALPSIDSLFGTAADAAGRPVGEARKSADGPLYRPRKEPVEIPPLKMRSGRLGMPELMQAVRVRVCFRDAARLERKCQKWVDRLKFPAYEG